MKLTELQIQELYTFTKKKGVNYIDLQDELVDHLVCAIEDKLADSPSLTFEKVFQTEYKKFGIFGFDGILMERSKQLEKKALRLFLNDILGFFKIPKIFFTICLFSIFYYLMSFNYLVEIVYYSVGLTSFTFLVYTLFIRFKDLKMVSSKYLVATQYRFFTQFCTSIFYWIVVWPIIVNDSVLFENSIAIPGLLSLIVLIVLIIREQLENLESYMEENYSVSA